MVVRKGFPACGNDHYQSYEQLKLLDMVVGISFDQVREVEQREALYWYLT